MKTILAIVLALALFALASALRSHRVYVLPIIDGDTETCADEWLSMYERAAP